MAREWLSDGVLIQENGTRQYMAEGVLVQETVAEAAPNFLIPVFVNHYCTQGMM
jgi:hypothetical protein